MCNFFSGYITKNRVFWCESDRHEDIKALRAPYADGARGPNGVSAELLPSAATQRLEDFDSYVFKIDQDILPDWFDAADAEKRMREAIAERFPAGTVDRVGSLIIPAHSHIICDALTSVGGYLYINADAKLDAPNLASVKGKPYKAVRP